MPDSPFTEDEVSDIVNKRKKYISTVFLDRSTTHADETVYLEGGKDIGLRFLIRPCENTIGTSLIWNNYRIRGINRKRGHRRCDRKKIRGWHQHVWKKQCGDKWIEPLSPKLFGTPPDPEKIIRYSFKAWKIIPRGGVSQQIRFDFSRRRKRDERAA